MPIRATTDRRASRDVLGGPVSLVRAVAPEHPAGHGGHVHLVDAVGDAHGGCPHAWPG
jgi:hypothetical protein